MTIKEARDWALCLILTLASALSGWFIASGDRVHGLLLIVLMLGLFLLTRPPVGFSGIIIAVASGFEIAGRGIFASVFADGNNRPWQLALGATEMVIGLVLVAYSVEERWHSRETPPIKDRWPSRSESLSLPVRD